MENEKKLDNILKKCENCGGNFVFSPISQNLKCENCGSDKAIEKIEGFQKHDYAENSNADDALKNDSWQAENKIMKCATCGATITLSKLEYAKNCPYCGSSYVSEVDELPSLKPDGVIPFAFDKTQASEKFRVGLKKKWFLPNKFKQKPPIDTINGIYVPTFGYDEDTLSSYNGKLETRHTTRDSNGHTSTYSTYQHISGNEKVNFRDYMIETSSNLNQQQFDEIKPYDVSISYNFNQDFIRGYAVEHYDNALANCKVIVDKKIDRDIERSILSHYHYDLVNYLNVSTTRSNEKFAYVIVPTYRVNYEYKKKKYATFMNGQTGKVGGGLPKSAIKITFFVLFLILIAAGIGFLFYYFNSLQMQ